MAVRRKPFGPKRPRDRELIVRDTYPPSSRAPKKPSGNTSKLYKGIFGRTKKDRKRRKKKKIKSNKKRVRKKD